MGGSIPKQFRSLNGRPMLWWSMKAFKDENKDTELIIVLPEAFVDLWKDFFITLPVEFQFDHKTVCGGATRSDSVRNGLDAIEEEDSLVAVHDAARPCLTSEIIKEGWKKGMQYGAAIPVVPVTDSLRFVEDSTSRSVDRSKYVAVQTPQIFKTSILKDSFEKIDDSIFTDEASLVEKNGIKIHHFPGSVDNIKVTNPRDLQIAGLLKEINV